LRTGEIPATYGGVIPFQVSNSLAAAGAAWGAGCPIDSIRLGLRTFQADDITAPGRFNIFEVGAARVVVDYGHNPHALRAIQETLAALRPRRCIGVVAAPGDRRDVDIEELAAIAADTFDHIIVREDDDLRGRAPGEVAQLIAGTIAERRPDLSVQIILDESAAVQAALEMVQPNDVAVLLIDKVTAMLDQVRRFAALVAASGPTAYACSIGHDPHLARVGQSAQEGDGAGRARRGNNRRPAPIAPSPTIATSNGEDRP
jgi:cyanophycin synthetase